MYEKINYSDPEVSSIDIVSLLKKGSNAKYTVDHSPKQQLKDREDNDKEGFLLCKVCNYPITGKNDRININDKYEYVFTNPHGYIFHIGCFDVAPGCIIYGEENSYFSWFIGYTWQIALCGRCGTLIGWFFRSKDRQFFGIILDKIS
jgi:hypothetical protein